MTSNHLMTGAAIGFAGFALWWITRKPGNQASTQPGQAVRDNGLQQWLDVVNTQYFTLSSTRKAADPLSPTATYDWSAGVWKN